MCIEKLAWHQIPNPPKSKFEKGKEQLAYYAKTLGLKEAIYLVFVPNTFNLPGIREQEETAAGVLIRTYIVQYDEKKNF